jgi:hypothetical protein
VCEQQERIDAVSARVILVAYDEPSLLAAKILRGLRLPGVLLLDRGREVYRRWGLGRTTLRASVLSPSLTWRYVTLLARGERFLGFAPDMFQLGGDFVLDRAGRVVFAHRMRDNGDRAPVADLLRALESAAR